MAGVVSNHVGLAAVLAIAFLVHGCGLSSDGEGLYRDGGNTGGFGAGGTELDASVDVVDSWLPETGKPDVPCFPPNKQCGSVCADYDDPKFGCAQPLDSSDPCAPCPVRGHGVPVCINSVCSTACETGWSDCDLDPNNGCEADTTTVTDCDGCGNTCAPAKATPACVPGNGCGIAACDTSWDDCNHNPTDGCEQDLRDRDNCGACGVTCHNQGATTYTCATGICLLNSCPPGYANCDGVSSNGCETDIRTASNCGACGKACEAANAVMACADLGGSILGCRITSCIGSFRDCDSNPGNGCETDIHSNVNHCGSCAGSCASTNVATRTCQQGLCVPNCANGFGNCNGPAPGQSDDGCEHPVSSDLNNCAACDNVCPTPSHATPSCTTGVCGFTCLPGWGDCTEVPGCETDITTTSNCGACQAFCPIPPHATATCTNSACGFDCESGYGDCSASRAGCETRTSSDKSNCGSCDTICSTLHASATCTSGSCVLTCKDPWSDCDGNVTTGCETDTDTDVAHCGGCNLGCPIGVNATHSCSAGNCVLTCNAGWTDCNNDGGCECPTLGFSCTAGKCMCAGDGTCSNGGICDTSTGLCDCGGTTCLAGQVCAAATTCG